MDRLARRPPRLLVSLGAAALSLPALSGAAAAPSGSGARTATPISHLVVIFQENVSFDHYFGTSPHALTPPGQPAFTARPDCSPSPSWRWWSRSPVRWGGPLVQRRVRP